MTRPTFIPGITLYYGTLALLGLLDILLLAGTGALSDDLTTPTLVIHLVLLGLVAVGAGAYARWLADRLPTWLNMTAATLHLVLVPFLAVPLNGHILALLSGPVLLALIAGSYLLALGRRPGKGSHIRVSPRVRVADLSVDERTAGSPGAGLYGSHYAAADIDRGVEGERRTAEIFREVLARHPDAIVGHSLRVTRASESDLDHVYITGSQILVVDSKMWRPRRNYELSYSPDAEGMFIHLLGDDGSFEEARSTAMPWMVHQVQTQFPGYQVTGVVCIHGYRIEAETRRERLRTHGRGAAGRLTLLDPDGLVQVLEDLARQEAGRPTDPTMLSTLRQRTK